jgi:two-component system, chemotaxis family, sensor kinase Cph1
LTTSFVSTDLLSCDQEAIQFPGSIQPHGMMLVAEQDGSAIGHAAGDIEQRLGVPRWEGFSLASVLGEALASEVIALTRPDHVEGFMGQLRTGSGEVLDVSAHLAGRKVIVEFETASVPPLLSASAMNRLSASAAALERTTSLAALCDKAASVFRKLTGFDRVMVYRFLHDDAGHVVAEDRRDGMHSFLNQHFPATDIPRQARDLYLRNLIRVIPDVAYAPVMLRPEWRDATPLDMSDCSLRSVSPIHLRYLANMGVRASASISIAIEGVLWGLIACHHEAPRFIPYDIRASCCSLASSLARQIKAKQEAEGYRQRIRLRDLADEVVTLLSLEGPLEQVVASPLAQIGRMMDSDGFVLLRGHELVMHGTCPPEPAIWALTQWLLGRTTEPVFAAGNLSARYPPAASFQAEASGLLAVTLSYEEPWMLLWFRAEAIDTVSWAGNPHKPGSMEAGAGLTPRTSFAAWQETVRAQAKDWSLPEIDAAHRLQLALLDVQQFRRVRELNRQLTVIVQDKSILLEQKEFLIGEVNHRVQNSLQLVSSFLSLQARASATPEVHAALNEARRRLRAVSLVHRRLYRGDQVETVDAARYIEELCEETTSFMGRDWAEHISYDLSPVIISTKLAVPLGLVLTELLININKHAYGGAPGPISIRLIEQRGHIQLIVADQGKGGMPVGKGFGSRIVDGLIGKLGGTLIQTDSHPGLRTTVTVPLRPCSASERRVSAMLPPASS